MSIRLDWEIEAEKEQLRGASEDPETKRRRRRAQMRFLLVVSALLLIIAGLIGAVSLRLRYIDWRVEQLLRDTVDAEIATLRIGDEGAFLGMQRSATDAWIHRQRATFAEYQRLKALPNTAFNGQIDSVTIDGTRARVQLREIVDGAEIARVWFYWRYDDGWRHVPPDVTFWGESATLQDTTVTVRYSALDERLAQQVFNRVREWITSGCDILTCDTVPNVTIEIVTDEQVEIDWTSETSSTIRLPSPYLDRVRVASPFAQDAQIAVADALAERLYSISANSAEVLYPTDAYYLRQAVISWLVARLTGVRTNSFLMESIARNYGEMHIGRLVDAMESNSSMALLAPVLDVSSIDSASLDWRDILTWRLSLEGQLIDRGAQGEFLALYDSEAAALAQARFMSGARAEGWVVTDVQPYIDEATGTARLRAIIDANGEVHEVIFVLADQVWKRAS
jgi:hypothetical protein